MFPAAAARGVSVIARAIYAAGYLVPCPEADATGLRPGQLQLRADVGRLASTLSVDPLQVAAWFVTATAGVTTALVGTTSARHLEQSLRYVRTRPSRDVMVQLAALAPGERRISAEPLVRQDGR